MDRISKRRKNKAKTKKKIGVFMLIKKCPLCDRATKKNKIILQSGKTHSGFVIIQCQECCLFYHQEYFELNECKQYYANSYLSSKKFKSIHNKFDIDTQSVDEKTIKKKQCSSIHKIEHKFPYIPDGCRVLEIGCGFGGVSLHLKKEKHCYVESIEVNQVCIKYLETQCLDKLHKDIFDNLEFPPESFDIVIAIEVLEHILKPKEFVEKIRNILKKDGLFILSTPVVPETLIQDVSAMSSLAYSFQLPHFTNFNSSAIKLLLKDFSKVDDQMSSGTAFIAAK
jgi:2-polyprenyl-3-methyl-5-hydroxy-6-metoxy-1,4-benzoquinol methylase